MDTEAKYPFVVVCGTPPVPNDPNLEARFDGVHCPKCGEEVMQGYGLAGGGMGVYFSCDGTDKKPCDFFLKHQDSELRLSVGGLRDEVALLTEERDRCDKRLSTHPERCGPGTPAGT